MDSYMIHEDDKTVSIEDRLYVKASFRLSEIKLSHLLNSPTKKILKLGEKILFFSDELFNHIGIEHLNYRGFVGIEPYLKLQKNNYKNCFSDGDILRIINGGIKHGDSLLLECSFSSFIEEEYPTIDTPFRLITDPNPYNLEIGKQYYIRYTHCISNWELVLINRITKFGHPWGEGKKHNGIITEGCYEIQEFNPERNLEI